jgi:hypothetical protein
MAEMWVLTDGELRVVEVSDAAEASLLGDYWNAVGLYWRTGDTARLEAFTGDAVRGRFLETDPDVIDEFGRQGEFDFDSIYYLGGSGG